MNLYEQALLALSDRTISFLSEDMQIKVMTKNPFLDSKNVFKPREHTAIIGLGGSVKGLVIFGFTDLLVQKLVSSFVYGEISDDEREELMGEVPAEVANTIIGNSIPNFPNNGKDVTITPPLVMEDSKAILKFKNSQVISCTIQTKDSDMLCALLY